MERYDNDAERHLFRALLSVVEFPSDGRPAVGADEQQVQLLLQEVTSAMTKPNFASLLCHGFEHSENKVSTRALAAGQATPTSLPLPSPPLPHPLQTVAPTANMLQNVCRGLRLTKVQEVSPQPPPLPPSPSLPSPHTLPHIAPLQVVLALGLTHSFSEELKQHGEC